MQLPCFSLEIKQSLHVHVSFQNLQSQEARKVLLPVCLWMFSVFDRGPPGSSSLNRSSKARVGLQGARLILFVDQLCQVLPKLVQVQDLQV